MFFLEFFGIDWQPHSVWDLYQLSIKVVWDPIISSPLEPVNWVIVFQESSYKKTSLNRSEGFQNVHSSPWQ